MEYIVEKERERCGSGERIVSFFFHSEGETEQRAGSALGFYRSICFQLFEDDEELLSKFIQVTHFAERSRRKA